MKRVFQLVRSSDGIRSVPVVCTREEFATTLFSDGKYLDGISGEDLVLCLGDVAEDDQFAFGQAPLMRVDNYITSFGASNG
jgi:hypothetical protein